MSSNSNPTDTAKHAIDLRLDAIDRALLGLLPRNERVELVAQIETKLQEFVAKPEAAHDEPQRPDHAIEAALPGPTTYAPHLLERRFAPRRPRSRLAVSSGVLGIVALALLATLPLIYVLISMLSLDGSIGGLLLCGQLAAVALSGLLAVVLGIAGLVVLGRHAGRLVGHGWAITGLCTGPLPLFAGGLVALAIGSQLWDSVTVQPAYSSAPITSQTVPQGTIAANPYAPSPAPSNGEPIGAYPAPLRGQPASANFNPYATPSSNDVSPEQSPTPPTPDAPPPAEAPAVPAPTGEPEAPAPTSVR